MENQDEFYVIIHVGVKYELKDIAKTLGAKYDTNAKNWYFKYLLSEFEENEDLHTFQFRPFKIHISIPFFEKFGEVARIKKVSECYNIISKRVLKYLEHLEQAK